ncbi:hypothetical protein GOARA_064_01370 [Gordonia araii NBRC 100433]|uniref:Uncharacterized protein n=1 Tax=Gordonia araii NBRC 100433 TaxID=1073574 RepID=G7H5L0_9ACTN|nr:hypothetical protein [Gordonia araii]NNG95848.1 hypothetical protein [Gordonia araii NBRC 100433]GAB11135.1 hypothetical protein GOARA_064_01370 [Gordonia araii NBRC 100433]
MSTGGSVVDALPGMLLVMGIFGVPPFAVIAAVAYGLRGMERNPAAADVTAARGLGTWMALAASVVLGVALWFAWLSWGGYYTDASGAVNGPYRPWQVIACALSVGAICAALGWFTRWRISGPLVVALGMIVGFATTWGVDAARHDGSGLWGVGYLLLAVGGSIALCTVATVVIGVRAWRAGQRSV